MAQVEAHQGEYLRSSEETVRQKDSLREEGKQERSRKTTEEDRRDRGLVRPTPD